MPGGTATSCQPPGIVASAGGIARRLREFFRQHSDDLGGRPKALTTVFVGSSVFRVGAFHDQERTSGAVECQSSIVTERSSNVTKKS